MSEKTSVVKNYLYNLSYQILLLIVPFVMQPYLARTLGIDNQGTFSVLFSLVSVFVMLGCVGLNVYGQREIAYYNRTEPERCERVFWEIQILRVIMLTLSLALYFAFAHFNLGLDKPVIKVEEPIYFAFFSLEIVASMFDISWYYQGIENFKLQTMRNFFVKIIGLALTIILVRDAEDLSIYIALYSGMNVIGNASLWLHKLKSSKFYAPQFKYLKKHIKNSFIMFLPQIATIVYAQLDRVMLGGLLDDMNFQAGVYDNAEKIVKIALTVVTSIGFVMLSRVASTYMKNDEKKTRKYIRSSFKLYLCLATPIMFGIASISDIFVARFFTDVQGAEYIAPVMIMLCPIIMFIGGSNVFGVQYLLPTNRMREYTLSVFTGMVLNVTLNFILIPKLGAIGAAMATVIAEFGVLLVQIIAVRREFNPVMFLFGWRYYIAGIMMFVCVYSLGRFMPHTFISLIVQIIIGIAVYFAIVIALRDRFVIKYMKKINNKISEKLSK